MDEIKIEIDLANKKLGKITMPEGFDVLEGAKLFSELALMSINQIKVKKRDDIVKPNTGIIMPIMGVQNANA